MNTRSKKTSRKQQHKEKQETPETKQNTDKQENTEEQQPDFIQETLLLVVLAQETNVPQYIQIERVIQLFNYIRCNLVQFYKTKVEPNPSREEFFLKLVNIIHYKSRQLYNQLSDTLLHLPKHEDSTYLAELCCTAMYTINGARNEIYEIAEPVPTTTSEPVAVAEDDTTATSIST
jgi:hypothetical protein